MSGPTAKDWMTLLEASFLVVRLQPWQANLGKRLVKSPKLYFCDPGLAAWLLNIREVGHLMAHPARGSLFENLVVIEAMKHFYGRGETPPLYFYRDAHGTEVDLVVERGPELQLAEVKGAMTVTTELTRSLDKVAQVIGERVRSKALIYGGSDAEARSADDVVPWHGTSDWLGKGT